MKHKQQAVFESIRTGLQEAIDYEQGVPKQPVRIHKVTIVPLPDNREDTQQLEAGKDLTGCGHL